MSSMLAKGFDPAQTQTTILIGPQPFTARHEPDGRILIATLEELTSSAVGRERVPDALGTVACVNWYGSAIELTYELADGSARAQIQHRDRLPRLEIAEAGRPVRSVFKHE